ncbi:GGDEF domain-containing protein [Natronincola peptidivorans]|uniref:GGDEF domain-containing protein n=1 Tax=Natronincola peptidivorans TaxID=426128 RepID=UPI00147CD7B2|nr:GGDEF domain-containing protein [Natronincola peptidivorans]
MLKEKDKEIIRLKKEIIVWKKQASLDYLTGVLNKREGMRRLKEAMKKALDNHQIITTAFIDIDRLKKANDKFGHFIGDQLLIDVSNILKSSIRKEDFIFRFGGDEFVMIFSNTKRLQAKEIWERIYKRVEDYNIQKNLPCNISLSIGFYEYRPSEKFTADKLVELADFEMYREKHQKWKEI